MTTKIIIKNWLGETYENYIHEEHECDMIDLLFNHKNKKEICPTNTNKYDNIEWFSIKLTEEDIKEIEKTSWYFNHKPTSYLGENSILEIISIQ